MSDEMTEYLRLRKKHPVLVKSLRRALKHPLFAAFVDHEYAAGRKAGYSAGYTAGWKTGMDYLRELGK